MKREEIIKVLKKMEASAFRLYMSDSNLSADLREKYLTESNVYDMVIAMLEDDKFAQKISLCYANIED